MRTKKMTPSFHSVIKRHSKMVFDLQRTLPLVKAIQKKVCPGDVVVDVGCGLGILAFAACHAGAKRVYAIDVDGESLEFALWQSKKLGVDKKICWIEDYSHHVDLIEKADVLIQETIGPLAFDENFLSTLMDAKKRFLKRGGKIIPEEVSLVGAPAGPGNKFLAKPSLLATIKTKSAGQTKLFVKKKWKLKSREKLKGVLLWPKIIWAKGCLTDCSPTKAPTHWGQTLLPYSNRYPVVKMLQFMLNISPHPKNPLYNSQTEWQIR